jgi:hypothetical protein
MLEVELGTISGGRDTVANDNGGGDSLYGQRGGHDLNQRRAAQYSPSATPSPSRAQGATPAFTPGGNLEPRATFAVSDEEELVSLIAGSSTKGCWRQAAAALDPEKWPRTTKLLTDGAGGLTRLDWIARLVMPVFFWVFYLWMYWYRRS